MATQDILGALASRDFSQQSSSGSFSSSTSPVPNYFYAADVHNVANRSWEITSPSTWGQGLDNFSNFLQASAVSGVASVWNSGVAAYNFLGGDAEEFDVATALSSYDSDLGKYYEENKSSVDLFGFVITSLVPGTLGVKTLNTGLTYLRAASKTGSVGANLSKATGLLGTTEDAARLAGTELAKQSATLTKFNADTIGAVAKGYGAAALESAAFELAVAGTMFKSPVLDEADGWDMTKNILLGTAIGGTVGGTLTAIRSLATIKGIVNRADEASKPYSFIPTNVGISTAEDTYVKLKQLETLKPLPEEGSEYFERFSRLRTKQEETLRNETYANTLKLAKGDSSVAAALHPQLLLMGADNSLTFLHSLEEISTLGGKVKAQKPATEFLTKTQETGSAKVMQESGIGIGPKAVRYIKLHGEGTGSIFDETPKIFNLADDLPKGSDVYSQVKKRNFPEKAIWSATASHLDTEARYIWAEKLAKAEKITKIGELDIPLLELAERKQLKNITLVAQDGSERLLTDPRNWAQEVYRAKGVVAESLGNGQIASAAPLGIEEIAKIVNVTESYLAGRRSEDGLQGLYARAEAQKEFNLRAIKAGTHSAFKPEIDLNVLPSWGKTGNDLTPVVDENDFELSGMSAVRTKQKIYQQQVEHVFASVVGDENLYQRFVDIPDEAVLTSNRAGAGPGIASSANGNYGTLNSFVETIGAGTAEFRKVAKERVVTQLNPVGLQLIDNPAAAIEFEAINQLIASTAEQYVRNIDGSASLIPKKQAKYLEKLEGAEGSSRQPKKPEIQPGAPMLIEVKTAEAWDAIEAHIGLNVSRVNTYKSLRAVQGKTLGWDPDAFYPIRPNPKDYKHVGFVVDETVTGAAGHVKMIHAKDAATLEQMAAKVPPEFKVYTRPETERYRELRGEYDHDRALTDTYMDSSLKRAGVNSQFFQKTDPQKIVQDFISHHTRAEDVLVRELVNAKYEKPFLELRRMAEQHDNLEKSTYGASVNFLENSGKNPYLSYIKTALDITQTSDYPLIRGFNTVVDAAFSKVYRGLSSIWNSTKKVDDLDRIHEALADAGVNTAYYDAATVLLANHSAPKSELSKFVRHANSLIATVSLGFDPSNALNNVLGQVMLATETKSVLRAIEGGNAEAVGKLATLMTQKIPGTAEIVNSPAKLIGAAIKNFFGPESKELLQRYKDGGWVTDISTQYKSMLDDLALQGEESVGVLKSKIDAAMQKAQKIKEKGEKLSGNKFAEEFNRFISADVMRQLTDLAIEGGSMTAREAKSYITTFVNRTQGNILASQRPLMFQGPVGQAIGLFQSYQFNLLQQVFRHVGEGSRKDAAFLLGLQGTLYGANGLPGFSYLNTHIVGTASGNPEHKDLYSATYGIVGEEVGDFLLYGAASSVLGANLYTRGDINPRQLTLIPVNPADIPIVNAFTKVTGNIVETVSKVAGGGDVKQVLLQGLEHNGLNRPLAGLAQVLQATGEDGKVFSTSKQGNLAYANDFWSISTAWRLVGSRPLDEALVTDAVYRSNLYQAKDREKRRALGELIKSTSLGNGEFTPEDIENLTAKYAETGGRQQNFNKWMLSQMQASTALQANEIASGLKTAYSKNMQLILGGRDLDGTESGELE